MDFSNLKPNDSATSTEKKVDPELQSQLSGLPATIPVKSLEKKVIDTVAINNEHIEVAKREAESFDILDTNSVMLFAIEPQKRYTESLKMLLGDSRVRDLGTGEMVIQKIREGLEVAEVDKMRKELNPNGLRKSIMGLPGVKKITSAFSGWERKKLKLQTLVDEVEKTIHGQMEMLVKENAKLDVLLEEVRDNFYQLGIYLYAGEEIVKRVAEEYKALREKAVDTGDALVISDLMVMKGQIQSFDSRLLEIKKAFVSAPIEMQNILMTQQSARIEMQTQMNSLLFTVPKLIKSLIRLVSLFNIKQAQEVRDQHNQLNRELDELAGNTLEDVATSAQQALIDAAEEANAIEQKAEETIALAQKLSDGSRQIKEAQEKADSTLAQVMDDFQKALTDSNKDSL